MHEPPPSIEVRNRDREETVLARICLFRENRSRLFSLSFSFSFFLNFFLNG